jgi:hypothetical protein
VLPVLRPARELPHPWGYFPAFVQAKILGTRSVRRFVDRLAVLSPGEITRLAATLTS